MINLIKDIPSKNKILTLHPKLRKEATEAYLYAMNLLNGENGIRITYSLRTFTQQNNLYNQGRDKYGNIINQKKVVTNAKGGQSYHNYGLALDFVLLHNDGKISYNLKEDLDKDMIEDWIEVAKYSFVNFGFEWGGEWNTIKDYPHVQQRYNLHWKELLELYKKNKVDSEGYIII